MGAFAYLFNTVIDLYIYCLIAMVILSWLLAFGVINAYNPFVARVLVFLEAITDPILRPIRRFSPVIGGLDLSVVVLFIGVEFFRRLVNDLLFY